jgi:hypothetical protein
MGALVGLRDVLSEVESLIARGLFDLAPQECNPPQQYHPKLIMALKSMKGQILGTQLAFL